MPEANKYVEQRNGGFYVAGARVSLDSIVHEFRNGASPEAIRDNFELLTLEQVYGAIAFYLGHQAEIDSYLDAEQRAFEDSRRRQKIPSALRARLLKEREQASHRRG